MESRNRFLHQLVWDLRALIWPLIGLLVLGVLFVFVELREFRQLIKIDQLSVVIWWVMVFVAAVAITLNVLKDPAVGERAFWFTRPIGFGRMWGVKFVVLLIVNLVLLFFWILPPVLELGMGVLGPYFFDYLIVYGALLGLSLIHI